MLEQLAVVDDFPSGIRNPPEGMERTTFFRPGDESSSGSLHKSSTQQKVHQLVLVETGFSAPSGRMTRDLSGNPSFIGYFPIYMSSSFRDFWLPAMFDTHQTLSSQIPWTVAWNIHGSMTIVPGLYHSIPMIFPLYSRKKTIDHPIAAESFLIRSKGSCYAGIWAEIMALR